MWYIIISSPVYTGSVVFGIVIIAAGLVYAFLTRDLEPSRYPLLKVKGQQFWYPGSRWRRDDDSERHLSLVQYSFCVDSDRRLSPVWSSYSTVYASMFANVSQNIRL